MEIVNLSNAELKKLLLEYHDKAVNNPESFSNDDLNESWKLAMESLLRSHKTTEEQSERMRQLERDTEDLIITDVTYRAAYKFIHDRGLQDEFESYLNGILMETISNVIPFPNNH